MAKITVDVQYDQTANALNIYWHYNGFARGHYFVDRGLIEERADNVRKALQELVDGYCAGSRAKYPDGGPSPQYQELLREVATHGRGLYNALFAGRERQHRDVATRVNSWLGRHVTADDIVVFTVPSGIHIPWGLIYDGPVAETSPFAVERESFWCIKHKLVTQYRYLAAEGVEVEWQPNEFALLLGAHELVWTAAYPLLQEEAHDVLNRLVISSAQPKFSRKDLLGQWRERRTSAPYGLVSFYCHATGTALCIGNETISDRSFQEEFMRDDIVGRPPTLVFLAGCQTAIGDLGPGFLGATSGPGFCGLIGTEVKTPDVFTLGFLASFLERFYDGGGSLSEIMKVLRERHWPLSLVFSMCCAGDLRLSAPALSVRAASGEPRNLSEYQIVSE
jgi:hypothetical protein